MKPTIINNNTDYYPALLWLMGEIKKDKAEDVIKEFGKCFSGLIPADHYDENKSGNVKWEHGVRWAREALKSIGFLDCSEYSIWKLSSSGADWLEKYPDGGGNNLKEYIKANKNRK